MQDSSRMPAAQPYALPPRRIRWLLQGIVIAFAAIQLGLTVANKSVWPFSAHNFFAFIPPNPARTLAVRFGDSQGNWTLDTHPGKAIPLEFFRANQVLLRFGLKGSPESRQALCSLILSRVVNAPWARFDETFPSVDLSGLAAPDRLRVFVVDKTFDSKNPASRGMPVRRRLLYECRGRET